MTITSVLLIILAVCIIPPIINVLFLYITVKFNLWTWISRLMYSEDYNDERVDSDSVMRAIIPLCSSMTLLFCLMFHLGTVIYYIVSALLFPFGKLLEWINNSLVRHFEKIEDKREFYRELNNHCK